MKSYLVRIYRNGEDEENSGVLFTTIMVDAIGPGDARKQARQFIDGLRCVVYGVQGGKPFDDDHVDGREVGLRPDKNPSKTRTS